MEDFNMCFSEKERRPIVVLEIILFLVLGIGVGTFGTLVGIGGGLICVPIFILFMSDGGIYPYFKTAAQITGTSLVIVMANAVSGTIAYIRQKRLLHAARLIRAGTPVIRAADSSVVRTA